MAAAKSEEVAVAVVKKGEVCFEWEQYRGVWVQYDAPTDALLRAASAKGETEARTTLNESPLTIDLVKMTQKNERTGFERNVRAVLKAKDGTWPVWEWQDDKGWWRSYPAECLLALEAAQLRAEPLCQLTVGDLQITVDLNVDGMKQRVGGGGERDVRRRVSAAAPSSSAAPVASARATRAARPRAAKQRAAAASSSTTDATVKAEPAAADLPDDGDDEAGGGDSAATTAGAKGKKSKAASKSRVAASAAKSKAEASSRKRLLLKGAAPVDPDCPRAAVAHVYSEGNDVYDAMLNQTNVQNNNNKYYVIQLLEDDGAKSFSVWFRWGRVGFKGQSNLVSCGADLEQAKKLFCSKFADKTKNDWAERDVFEKEPGKYDLIKMDYSAGNGKAAEDGGEASAAKRPKPTEQKAPPPPSQLDERLQQLLRLICDVDAMQAAVVELEYDAQKAPLGKLTPGQIAAGYAALKKIEGCIEKKDFGKKLVAACNDFYTRIPHSFGMRTPPLIKSEEALLKEMDLLEALAEIEVAMRTLNQADDSAEPVNPVDRHYASLRCQLDPLDSTHDEYKMVEEYLQNTHASTHRTYKMKIHNVFACKKEDEEFSDLGNRKLLWHGSRLSNWFGILSRGLRIAPPEAPVTGYMFGKGVYFADVSSKSTNYCFASRQHSRGFALLCDVSLGTTRDLLASDYKADRLPKGFDSTMGLGSVAPDPKLTLKTEEGVEVPLGKPEDMGVNNPDGYTLNYNEYVVYNTKQIRMKYLVEIDFQF